MNKKHLVIVGGIIAFLLVINGLVGGNNKVFDPYEMKVSPVQTLMSKYAAAPTYSILMVDMDDRSSGYYQKFKVIYEDSVSGKVLEDRTDWIQVSKEYYYQNKDYLGMEIAGKGVNGTSLSAAPPGYGSFVGNERYGRWKDDNGNRVWEFIGTYLILRTMLDLATYPIYYSRYNSYYTNYWRTRPYYGYNSYYGTNSRYTKSRYKNYYSRTSKRNASRSSSRSWSRGNSSRSWSRGGGGFGK